MRFEDYLDRELCESISSRENYDPEAYVLEKERRRQQSRYVMLTITACCFITLLFLVTIGFFTQDKPKEKVEILYEEPIEVAVVEEIAVQCIEEEVAEEEISEDFENEKIQDALLKRANRIDNVKVTHYCAEKYPHICNAGEPYKTAGGHDVVPDYTCAVDPKKIPLGSTVFVDYGDGVIYEYLADDTGGAIKGTKIDVAVDTHQHALERGIKTATVWWIKE